MSVNLNLRCHKHRAYKGMREPRAECAACWKIYSLAHVDIQYQQDDSRLDIKRITNADPD